MPLSGINEGVSSVWDMHRVKKHCFQKKYDAVTERIGDCILDRQRQKFLTRNGFSLPKELDKYLDDFLHKQS